MSAGCKSLQFVLQRCVAFRPLRVTAAIKTRSSAVSGSRWSYIQQRAWTSDRTAACLRRLRELQPALTCLQRRFCTEAGSPCKEEYPPLPDYQANSQSGAKEVYIVQVKGLPWSCTVEDLQQFFSDCRIRDGEKGIHLTLDRLGRPSGRAFIEMEHEDDISKALEKHKKYLGPRYVEVYEVTNSDAEDILRKEAAAGPEEGVVMLRGLPFSCTEDDIVRFFSDLSIVENGITIVKNSMGKNSGEAYVQFSSQEEADKALEKDREHIGRRYIEVFPSNKDNIQSSSRRRTTTSPNPFQSVSRRPVPDSQTNHKAATSVSHQISAVPTHYIHVRGLPYQVSGEDIMKILIEFGPTGRPNGEADVFFHSHRDAVDAMSRDRMNMGHRYIELFLNSMSKSA